MYMPRDSATCNWIQYAVHKVLHASDTAQLDEYALLAPDSMWSQYKELHKGEMGPYGAYKDNAM